MHLTVDESEINARASSELPTADERLRVKRAYRRFYLIGFIIEAFYVLKYDLI